MRNPKARLAGHADSAVFRLFRVIFFLLARLWRVKEGEGGWGLGPLAARSNPRPPTYVSSHTAGPHRGRRSTSGAAARIGLHRARIAAQRRAAAGLGLTPYRGPDASTSALSTARQEAAFVQLDAARPVPADFRGEIGRIWNFRCRCGAAEPCGECCDAR